MILFIYQQSRQTRTKNRHVPINSASTITLCYLLHLFSPAAPDTIIPHLFGQSPLCSMALHFWFFFSSDCGSSASYPLPSQSGKKNKRTQWNFITLYLRHVTYCFKNRIISFPNYFIPLPVSRKTSKHLKSVKSLNTTQGI